jgi:UDP-glucuronate 4-epimerase
MSKILVTGGAGFVGSNLVNELLKEPTTEVICIDNFDSFYSKAQKQQNINAFLNLGNFRFIDGDIRNYEHLSRVGKVDVIVHLAAKAGVRPSIADPSLYQDVNIAGTQNLLEYAKNTGVGQFVFASSSSVYGINKNLPWNESERPLPISPYASSKLSDEMLGHVYSHLYGIRFIALRLFTVYGPAQRPDLAIYKFFDLILNGLPIPVFGDGSTSRDYTYVKDIVNGFQQAICYDRTDFEVVNLGNNNAITLLQLIKTIETVCAKKAILELKPEQPGDVSRTFADIAKARELLGYCPTTSLADGLSRFYNWYRSDHNRSSLKSHV